MIKLKFFALLRELIGISEIDLELKKVNTSIKEILLNIEKIPKNIGMEIYDRISSPKFKIFLNGELIDKTEYNNLVLKENDQLSFLPPVGGG